MDNGFYPFSVGNVLSRVEYLREKNAAKFVERAATEYAGFCGEVYRLYVDVSTYVLRMEDLPRQLAALGKIVGWPQLNIALERANASKTIIDEPAPDLSLIEAAEPEAMRIWRKAGL